MTFAVVIKLAADVSFDVRCVIDTAADVKGFEGGEISADDIGRPVHFAVADNAVVRLDHEQRT